MDFIFDWEAEGDRFSFEDSDRFEEDSLCSWISEPESLCNNWRGWRKPNGSGTTGLQQNQICSQFPQSASNRETSLLVGQIPALVELAAQAVACHIPFEIVEHFYPPIPEQLQLRIAFWSFPENEEDIRLYSCLANGSADEFQKGEQLFKAKAVNDALQIGFHLSATVTASCQSANAASSNSNAPKGDQKVALVFDRRHITSCSCSCSVGATWCAHIVALCLFRIHQPNQVCLRAPVSESLSRLERDQLQKFAQYLISALPQQLLPIAQRLLDDLLSSQQSEINTFCGAPDPTAGPSASEQTTWCLNDAALHENIRKTLNKFCVPSPMVLSDVNFLANSAPPAATEWQTLLRPLRGREPEGIWNLLSIVREMFRRNDANASTLLEIITDELLASEQILTWWFNNKSAHHHGSVGLHGNRNIGGQGSGSGGSSGSAPHAAAGLCDEVVTLWRLAALNPSLTAAQRNDLSFHLLQWQKQCLDRLCKVRQMNSQTVGGAGTSQPRAADIEAVFPGFRPAVEACQLDWTNLALPDGVADLLKYRSHWGQVSGAWAPTKAGSAAVSSCVVGSPSSYSGNNDCVSGVKEDAIIYKVDGSNTWLKETGRKVLMPSERSPHSTMRPTQVKCTARKVDSDDPDGTASDNSLGNCRQLVNGAVNGHGKHIEVVSSSSDQPVVATLESGNISTAADQLHLEEKQLDMSMSALSLDGVSGQGESNSAGRESKQEILFALAEALHAHGHTQEACRLARQLAEDMLAADAISCVSVDHSAHHKDKSKKVTITSFASSMLAKVSFLCTVLLEDPDSRHLAFRIGLYGMEMPRPPAASKSLEVKLAHQEFELATLLKKLTLGPSELAIIRDRAEKLRDGKLKMRGDALLPITLATFIFDSLCVGQAARSSTTGNQLAAGQPVITLQDEKLGFDAAVAALGLKANVSEAEHPLLCEGTRRQKGELAVAMLVQYKDDPSKLARIMDKLLDKDVHQLYKASPHDCDISNYFGSNSASGKTTAGSGIDGYVGDSLNEALADGDEGFVVDGSDVFKATSNHERESSGINVSASANHHSKVSGIRAAAADSAAVDDDTEGSGDYKAWEAKFRCTNLKSAKKHSVGMASIDSSAPETTSSDNSPTLIRRNNFSSVGGGPTAPMHHAGPGSDSGSSHSDSVDSSSSGCKQSTQHQQQQQQSRVTLRSQPRDTECTLNVYDTSQQCVYNRSLIATKGSRYKIGKNRIMPLLPNQPSEASAHFMFELAKTVLIKAGGNSSTSMFVNQTPASATNNSQSGPHRALHLCAFQIGLYALGLHNCVSLNWLSRTYSSHVSWITGQANEIGYPAIEILIKTWEGHLTPQEAASLADRASRCRDPHMVRAAAELALSCLRHAHALNTPEIQRALTQCKEQSSDMLQRACLSVESLAKDGGVCPEVLFEVAKRWYELYEESSQSGSLSGQPHQPIHAAAPPLGTATVSFPGVRENTMAMQSAPPSASQEGIAVLQLAPSSAGPAGVMNGAMGSYQPGAMSFVPPQPIQIVQHPYAQYTYVHQLTGPNQAASAQPRPNFTYFSLPMQQPAQTIHIPRYPYQGPYLTTGAAAAPPNLGLSAPTAQQLTMAPAYLPQGMQASPASIYHPGVSTVRPPPVQLAYLTAPPMSNRMSSAYGGISHPIDAVSVMEPNGAVLQQQQQPQQPSTDEIQGAGAATGISETVHNNYMLAAFRVGMLAMDTLAKRVHDDRPNLKYSRTPPYGDDVKWLLSVSFKLGASYLQQFCASVVNAIVSPFVLLDIAMESANFLACNNLGQASQQIRLPMINSLLQKCLQMFGMCTQARLHHITPSDYDDFVGIVCSARNAFCMVPNGMTQFNEMLQSLRRSKHCKKDLWQRVIAGLHSTNSV